MIVHNISHTYFNLDVFHVILLITGTLEKIYVRAVLLLLYIKIKQEDAYVQNKSLIFLTISVFNVYIQDFGIQLQKIVKYVLKHFNLIFIDKRVFVQPIIHFCKMEDAYHVIHQNIGMISESNAVRA